MFDWNRALTHGMHLAHDQVRSDVEPTDIHAMWALLKEAAQVSTVAFKAPPRTGFPAKSAMPEAPDEISPWEAMLAYLRGQTSHAPQAASRRSMPSAAQISRAEAVLDVWHRVALKKRGTARRRLKTAIYMQASGCKVANIHRATGLTRQQLHVGRRDAMRDMLGEVLEGVD